MMISICDFKKKAKKKKKIGNGHWGECLSKLAACPPKILKLHCIYFYLFEVICKRIINI